MPDEVDQNNQQNKRQHEGDGVEELRVDLHDVLQMVGGEVREMHGAPNAHDKRHQSDYFDDEALAETLESEEKEDNCYYYVEIIDQLFSLQFTVYSLQLRVIYITVNC